MAQPLSRRLTAAGIVVDLVEHDFIRSTRSPSRIWHRDSGDGRTTRCGKTYTAALLWRRMPIIDAFAADGVCDKESCVGSGFYWTTSAEVELWEGLLAAIDRLATPAECSDDELVDFQWRLAEAAAEDFDVRGARHRTAAVTEMCRRDRLDPTIGLRRVLASTHKWSIADLDAGGLATNQDVRGALRRSRIDLEAAMAANEEALSAALAAALADVAADPAAAGAEIAAAVERRFAATLHTDHPWWVVAHTASGTLDELRAWRWFPWRREGRTSVFALPEPAVDLLLTSTFDAAVIAGWEPGRARGQFDQATEMWFALDGPTDPNAKWAAATRLT